MDLLFANMRRLDERGPASRRVVVDAEGATLGPDCVLVWRTLGGYHCLRRDEAALIQNFLFRAEDDPDRLLRICRRIAAALNAGELALAQICGLRIPVFELDSRQLKQLAAAAPFIKANFNPEEPRDDHGRWTGEGGESESERETAPPAAPIGAAAASAAEASASIFGPLGRTALASLTDFAAGMAGPTAFFAVLFLPANRSLVTEGPLPGRPDLGYRYDRDTGVLDIYRQGEAGRPLLVSAHIGADGRFYDADGRVIGRSLGSTVLVDPEALPAPLGLSGAEVRVASASERDQPKLCPDRSNEDIAGRSERSLAYQEQISQLPRGFEVKLNGVRFDGCRTEDGTMLEAKGPGFANKLDEQGKWLWWFTGGKEMEQQMIRQSRAGVGRQVEWHFAEPSVADYFHGFAKREEFSNIVVRHTPAEAP